MIDVRWSEAISAWRRESAPYTNWSRYPELSLPLFSSNFYSVNSLEACGYVDTRFDHTAVSVAEGPLDFFWSNSSINHLPLPL